MCAQHQLENHTGDFCCTVQGFQYADDDDLHWPYMQFKVLLSPSSTRSARKSLCNPTATFFLVRLTWTAQQLRPSCQVGGEATGATSMAL